MSSVAADPCILVIFGASGDLTRRTLLPEPFAVLSVARPAIDEARCRSDMREHVGRAEGGTLDADAWTRIEERLHYVSGDFNDRGLFERTARALADIGARHHIPANYLFYLAVPPDLFSAQPILDAWARDRAELPVYRAGSPGPSDADVLLEHDGRQWLD
ncbi:MAG: hypothetical protein FJW14_19575 [Acidimicrobiia bacterium]|nr:hypothetical protein [Acidimicrobiia bacterium]